jgi:hypothetical protein
MTVNRWEAAMRHDDNNDDRRLHVEPQTRVDEAPDDAHVVYDFTSLEKANIGDVSLILTARLTSAPTDSVWVRSIPARTARILEYLRLDHLFRRYPQDDGSVN